MDQASASSATAPARGAPEAQSGPAIIFIGSGEATVVEQKVLIYSLHKHTRRPLDIRVFNGTHNALEHAGRIDPLPLPLRIKYRSGDTEFGLCRYLVPELCGRIGRALYLDSDMICLADIGALFDTPLGGADLLALPGETSRPDDPRWRTSVMPVDCATTRFDLEAIFGEIERGEFSQNDLMQMAPRFLAKHPLRIAPLDPAWNALDVLDPSTKLIHYTNMYTQPWKRPGHPHGALWFRYFREACEAGLISERDIEFCIRRGSIRRDIRRAFGWRERLAAALARYL